MPIITQSVINSATVNGSNVITIHGVTAGNIILVAWQGLTSGAVASNWSAADTAGNSYPFAGRESGLNLANTPYSAGAMCVANSSGDLTITITRLTQGDTIVSMAVVEIRTLGSGTLQFGAFPYGANEGAQPTGAIVTRGPFNGNSNGALHDQVLVQIVAVGATVLDGQPVPNTTPPGAGWTALGGSDTSNLSCRFFYQANLCASTVFPTATFNVPPSLDIHQPRNWVWDVGFIFPFFLFPVPPGATGNIVIQKATNPPGSPQAFTFTSDYGPPFTLTDGMSNDSGQLPIGTYSVTEEPVFAWLTTPSQDPSAIMADSGATTTVTFTNTFGAPVPSAPCVPAGGNGVFVSDLELYIGPSTALYNNPVPSADLNFYETVTEGRHAVVLDFNTGEGLYARDLGTIFSWPIQSGTVLYVWQPSIIPMPEGTYGRATDWLESGGAKFIQGVIIEADSFNNAKTFMLQDADTLAMHALNEMPATFNQQSVRAFSCVSPFVAHSARVVSTDGVEWRVWSTKLVFQPWPELCFNWQTEMTSLGMVGWGHVREMNVPYVSTSPVTLNLVFDAWPTITLTLPSTGGLQAKTKVTLPANKFKLISLQTVSGDPGHRIFADDLQLKIKAWGSTESYQVLRPFGGPSRTGATV